MKRIIIILVTLATILVGTVAPAQRVPLDFGLAEKAKVSFDIGEATYRDGSVSFRAWVGKDQFHARVSKEELLELRKLIDEVLREMSPKGNVK